MKDNKKKFSIGDLVKAQKGLFNDENKGGYGIILEVGLIRNTQLSSTRSRISNFGALIRWPDGTNTKIFVYTQGWVQTEVVAKA